MDFKAFLGERVGKNPTPVRDLAGGLSLQGEPAFVTHRYHGELALAYLGEAPAPSNRKRRNPKRGY